MEHRFPILGPSRNRRAILSLALAGTLAAMLAGPGAVQAQDKDAPIRIVMPYTPGGSGDTMVRLLSDSMRKTLNRNVIIEHKPGAASLIGIRYVMASPPNGDTLIFLPSSFLAMAQLNKNANLNPARDLMPVASIGTAPVVLMVHQSVAANNLQEFIAWARKREAPLEAGNAGLYSGGHIYSMLFAKRAGIKMLQVPYKGGGEAATALITGDVKLQLTSTNDMLNAQVKAGKIKILAVTSEKPTSLVPGVPTMNEALPGFYTDGWSGLFVAAGTPPEKVASLSAAVKVALDEPGIRQKFMSLYTDPVYRNPADFKIQIERSAEYFRSAAAELDLTPQ
jgi:tripartite-type tricarboxylate transporter receptor subunit TctC